MYHGNAQGVDERMINVHYYLYVITEQMMHAHVHVHIFPSKINMKETVYSILVVFTQNSKGLTSSTMWSVRYIKLYR